MKNNTDTTRFADYCNETNEYIFAPGKIRNGIMYVLWHGEWVKQSEIKKPELRRKLNSQNNPCRKAAVLQ